jgi:hypothetical protein
MQWFAFSALIAAIYCVARGIADLRAKRFAWGLMGLLSAAVFLFAPIETHAVKIDFPAPASGN